MAGEGPSIAVAGGRRAALGLRERQTLLVGVLLAILSALLVWYCSAAAADEGFEALRRRGAALARLVALLSEPSLSGAGSDPQRLVDRLGGEEDVAFLELVDPAGAVLAEGGSAGTPVGDALAPLPADAARAPFDRSDLVKGLQGQRLYLFTYPVRRRGEERPPAASGRAGRATGLGPTSAS